MALGVLVLFVVETMIYNWAAKPEMATPYAASLRSFPKF